ncbi:MAG TPA: ferredoxin reductase [Actinomycetes bacterium]
MRDETRTARTLVLDVPDWPGHLPGQHVDLRLTAADGYSATRSYSIASASDGTRVEVTVELVPDGEVSPYLTGQITVGTPLELRGPLGGWFVWRPGAPEPVQLVGGGSGLVPLMAMLRTRERTRAPAPFRLLCSARDPGSLLYAEELGRLTDPHVGDHPRLTVAWTRTAPDGEERPPGRVDAALVSEVTWPADREPTCYVCGPTGFVETIADLLVAAGHDPARIRTERFGPTGGARP